MIKHIDLSASTTCRCVNRAHAFISERNTAEDEAYVSSDLRQNGYGRRVDTQRNLVRPSLARSLRPDNISRFVYWRSPYRHNTRTLAYWENATLKYSL